MFGVYDEHDTPEFIIRSGAKVVRRCLGFDCDCFYIQDFGECIQNETQLSDT